LGQPAWLPDSVIMSDSIFVLTNKLIRKIPAVKDYQGDDPNSSMQDHVGSSMIFSLLGTILFFINPWTMFLELGVWFYYAPFTEFVRDEEKNAGKVAADIYAQIVERSVGFVLLAPLKFLALL